MSRILPILFNTDMVQTILDGRKTVTRRAIKNLDIKENNGMITLYEKDEDDAFSISSIEDAKKEMLLYSSYQPGDILYVRETWNYVYDMDGGDRIIEETGRYIYYADASMPFSHWVDPDTGEHKDKMPWRPSIHMPKAAARIWLKVTDVRVEQLQDINGKGCIAEGVEPEALEEVGEEFAKGMFHDIWDSTIKKADTDQYGWDANPWVWMIEFERCERPEPCIIKGIEPASDKRPCIGYQKSKGDDEPCEMCKGCKCYDGDEEVEDA